MAAEEQLDFAFQDVEHLLEIVAVRGRAATGRNVHVDQRVMPGRLLSGNEDGVNIADDRHVRQRVGPGDDEVAGKIVWRKHGRGGVLGVWGQGLEVRGQREEGRRKGEGGRHPRLGTASSKKPGPGSASSL